MTARGIKMMLILFLGTFTRMEAYCQSLDYDYVKSSEAWLSSKNAAGLKRLPVDGVSRAGIRSRFCNGGFVNYNESDKSFIYGLSTESFLRAGNSIVFSGSVSYDAETFESMSGSVFMNPSDNLFDILDDEQYPGVKKKEMYRLKGGIAWSATPRLTIGTNLGYESGNYAKMKDLRHVNSLLDLDFAPGFSYYLGRRMLVGLNLAYRRRVESVGFQQSGQSSVSYNSLVSFGNFYGQKQVFSDGNYNAPTSQPLFDEYLGSDLQFSFEPLQGLKIFNELSYRDRSGYYGIRSSKSIVFSEHKGRLLGLSGEASYTVGNDAHRLEYIFQYSDGNNNQNVYSHVNDPETGNTVIKYSGSNEAGRKSVMIASVAYTFDKNIASFLPRWELTAAASFWNRHTKASVYPFYRNQDLSQLRFDFLGKHNLVRGSNRFSTHIGASVAKGGGEMYVDGFYTQPSSSQKEPSSSAYFLKREYEYLTAARTEGSAIFEYSRTLNKSVAAYVSINCLYLHAFAIESIGADRIEACISIGTRF